MHRRDVLCLSVRTVQWCLRLRPYEPCVCGLESIPSLPRGHKKQLTARYRLLYAPVFPCRRGRFESRSTAWWSSVWCPYDKDTRSDVECQAKYCECVMFRCLMYYKRLT